MSTTPTLNSIDDKLVLDIYLLFDEYTGKDGELRRIIASYRAEIESAQAKRISTLEKALSEAELAITHRNLSDHLTLADKALTAIRQAKVQA